jgi:feruloyl-CoA synthase
VVIAGADRDLIGVLIFPDVDACRRLAPDLKDAGAADIVAHERVRREFRVLLNRLAKAATGSSLRVARAILLDVPPSLDVGEATDKGSINQRTVLRHRAALVQELYASAPSPRVMAGCLAARRRAHAVRRLQRRARFRVPDRSRHQGGA